MNNFVKLSDLCTKITDGSHYSPEGVDTGYPMFSVKDMRDRGFSYDDCKFINETEYQNMVANGCVPQKNDVLIAKDGSYLKHVFVITENKEEAVLSSIGILRPDMTKVNPYYIKYYLSSEFVKKQVKKKYVSGSALPRIILKNFENIEIPYVGLDIQNKIVSVLKSFDDKITNNENINAELESLAKTIYDYWFLQFEFPNEKGLPYKSSGGKMVWSEELKREIPEGWGVGTLKDYGEIVAGGTPDTENPEFYCEHGISWITPKDLSITNDMYISHGERDITELGLKKSSAVLMPKGSVLMSSRAPIGYLAISLNEITTNQGFKSIVPKKEYGSEFVYYTLRTYVPAFIKKSGQTTFKEVSKGTLEEFSTFVPDERVLTLFNSIIHPLGEKRVLLEKENRELAALRDWLLPMLMNGQVGFKDVE